MPNWNYAGLGNFFNFVIFWHLWGGFSSALGNQAEFIYYFIIFVNTCETAKSMRGIPNFGCGILDKTGSEVSSVTSFGQKCFCFSALGLLGVQKLRRPVF